MFLGQTRLLSGIGQGTMSANFLMSLVTGIVPSFLESTIPSSAARRASGCVNESKHSRMITVGIVDYLGNQVSSFDQPRVSLNERSIKRGKVVQALTIGTSQESAQNDPQLGSVPEFKARATASSLVEVVVTIRRFIPGRSIEYVLYSIIVPDHISLLSIQIGRAHV